MNDKIIRKSTMWAHMYWMDNQWIVAYQSENKDMVVSSCRAARIAFGDYQDKACHVVCEIKMDYVVIDVE